MCAYRDPAARARSANTKHIRLTSTRTESGARCVSQKLLLCAICSRELSGGRRQQSHVQTRKPAICCICLSVCLSSAIYISSRPVSPACPPARPPICISIYLSFLFGINLSYLYYTSVVSIYRPVFHIALSIIPSIYRCVYK